MKNTIILDICRSGNLTAIPPPMSEEIKEYYKIKVLLQKIKQSKKGKNE